MISPRNEDTAGNTNNMLVSLVYPYSMPMSLSCVIPTVFYPGNGRSEDAYSSYQTMWLVTVQSVYATTSSVTTEELASLIRNQTRPNASVTPDMEAYTAKVI